MVDTYTSRNRLTKQTVGGNIDTWGSILNNVLDLVDASLDGITSFAISAPKTLTATNGVNDEARARVLFITGGTGGSVTIPDNSKVYFVINNADFVTFIRASGGNSDTFPKGSSGFLINDGTQCRRYTVPGKYVQIANIVTTSGTQALFGASNFINGGDYWDELLIGFNGFSHSTAGAQALRISCSGTSTHSVFQTIGSFPGSASLWGSLNISGHNPLAANNSATQLGGLISGCVGDIGTSNQLGTGTIVGIPWRGNNLREILVDFNGATFDAGSVTLYGRG